MTKTNGKVTGVNGNMVTVLVEGAISMNEVAYIETNGKRLKREVIRIRGDSVQVQVFEMTKGIHVGDSVSFTGEMLAVELGPGLLGQIYDGLQNPLPKVAEKAGHFLEPGVYLDALPRDISWAFTPTAKVGDKVRAADLLGTVPEGSFTHASWCPSDSSEPTRLNPSFRRVLQDHGPRRGAAGRGRDRPFRDVHVRMACQARDHQLRRTPQARGPMVTHVRLIDTFFP